MLQKHVRTLLCGRKEITDKNQINHHLDHFYKTLFTEKLQIQNENITAYLNQISIPVLTGERPGRKLGNLGNFFSRILNPSFRFWL